jgi:hypothetical protein
VCCYVAILGNMAVISAVLTVSHFRASFGSSAAADSGGGAIGEKIVGGRAVCGYGGGRDINTTASDAVVAARRILGADRERYFL